MVLPQQQASQLSCSPLPDNSTATAAALCSSTPGCLSFVVAQQEGQAGPSVCLQGAGPGLPLVRALDGWTWDDFGCQGTYVRKPGGWGPGPEVRPG